MKFIAGKATQEAPPKASGKSGERFSGIEIPKPQPVAKDFAFAYSIGEFRLARPINLTLDERDGRAVIQWREANLEITGETLGEALDAFAALFAREVTKGNETVRAFLI